MHTLRTKVLLDAPALGVTRKPRYGRRKNGAYPQYARARGALTRGPGWADAASASSVNDCAERRPSLVGFAVQTCKKLQNTILASGSIKPHKAGRNRPMNPSTKRRLSKNRMPPFLSESKKYKRIPPSDGSRITLKTGNALKSFASCLIATILVSIATSARADSIGLLDFTVTNPFGVPIRESYTVQVPMASEHGTNLVCTVSGAIDLEAGQTFDVTAVCVGDWSSSTGKITTGMFFTDPNAPPPPPPAEEWLGFPGAVTFSDTVVLGLDGVLMGNPISLTVEVPYPLIPIEDLLLDLIPDRPMFQDARDSIVPGSGDVPVGTFIIPEPSVLSVLAVGGLALSRRRQRSC